MPEGGYDVMLEYDGYYGGGMWADSDAEEEPLEQSDDHSAADSGADPAAGVTGGGGADPAASGGGNGGGDDPGTPDGGDEDPADPPPQPVAVPASGVPPELQTEKEVHYVDKAEGPFPKLLWEAMQAIGVSQRPRFVAHSYEDPDQQEEWRVSAVLTVLDLRSR